MLLVGSCVTSPPLACGMCAASFATDGFGRDRWMTSSTRSRLRCQHCRPIRCETRAQNGQHDDGITTRLTLVAAYMPSLVAVVHRKPGKEILQETHYCCYAPDNVRRCSQLILPRHKTGWASSDTKRIHTLIKKQTPRYDVEVTSEGPATTTTGY